MTPSIIGPGHPAYTRIRNLAQTACGRALLAEQGITEKQNYVGFGADAASTAAPVWDVINVTPVRNSSGTLAGWKLLFGSPSDGSTEVFCPGSGMVYDPVQLARHVAVATAGRVIWQPPLDWSRRFATLAKQQFPANFDFTPNVSEAIEHRHQQEAAGMMFRRRS